MLLVAGIVGEVGTLVLGMAGSEYEYLYLIVYVYV